MKKQSVQRWLSSLLTTITIALMFGAFTSAVAQEKKSIGERYGSREPRTCEAKKAPAMGAPTADLAAKYVICEIEKVSGQYLYLIENVKVEVGGGRPYNPNSDINVPEIDVKFPIYSIRGSLTKYQCNAEDARFTHSIPGKNCTRYEEPKAKGDCYKTTFSEWRCYMTDLSNLNENYFAGVPPPGATKMAADMAATNNKLASTKNANPTAKPKDEPKNGKDESGFLKPDFSEMEKYYGNIRYEYDFNLRRLNIVGKMKKPNNPNTWLVDFYDADGARLSSNNGTILIGLDSSVGQVVKVYTNNLPSEMQMRNVVKKIVVTRKID